MVSSGSRAYLDGLGPLKHGFSAIQLLKGAAYLWAVYFGVSDRA